VVLENSGNSDKMTIFSTHIRSKLAMQGNSSLEKQPQLTEETKSFPLSYGQQAMWFLYQIAPQSIAYNIYTTVRINSELDLEAWHRAWLQIVEGHPILRTTYTQYEDQPIQIIHPYQEIDIKVTDASAWELDYLEKKILVETERPYNLETGPVVRVHLFTRSSEEHIQLLAMHHIAGDMWSFDILLNELQILYAIEVKTSSQADLEVIENSDIYNSQTDNSLSLPKLSYTDYVSWQTEMLSSSQGEQISAYWHKQLAGELPVLDLPLDKLRPNVQTYSGSTHIIKLDEELLSRLRKLSELEKTSLYRIFLAAFFILFYRLSGQEDILVGCPVAGRSGNKEFESIVGYFTDPIVLRGNLGENPTFRDFLAQISRTVSEGKKHEDYPFPLLVRQLIHERDSSRPPLFQVSLTWQEHRWYDNSQKSSLVMSPFLIEGHQRGAAFDIDLAIIKTGSEFNFCWQYNTDLFNISTVERIAGNYQTLLESILINPQQPISQLPLLTEIEQYQLLVDWNNTKKEYPLDKCIHQLFEEQVIKTPEAIAVEWEGEKLTYQELNQRANQLANYLQKLGVNPEVLVGICVERSLLMVVGLLGILKAGGAYVPLDPAYPAERLAYMLDDSQAKVLLTQQQLVNSIPNTDLQVICLDTNWELISTQSDKNSQTQVKANNLAYVIYTSGSTGKPKGVMIEHRSLANFAQTVKDKYEISNRDRVLQAASISFDAAAEEIYPCLVSGATLVLRTAEMLGTVSTFIQKCWEWELTVLMMGTAYWHQLTAELATTNETLPPSVRLLANGGEQWLPEKLNLWQKSMEYRSRVQNLKAPPMLMNGYGPTEATVLSTVYNLSELRLENTQGQQIIGTPFDNVQAYILDSFLQPVPIGVPGELHIGGMGLARGYLHHPDLTDAKFIAHPFKQSERIYKTGDLARYLPNGNIEFLGRIDNQVKIRGFRIELGEIETLLITHPQISEAVVIDSDDIPGVKRLVAYVVTRTSSEIKNQLRSFLKQKLPDYMIPSAFVVLDALPLTPNGKVDRRNLPKPDQNRPDSAANYVAPQTDVERTIATVWEEVLHLENIGIHDNFFEIGGHSLLATQIISRLRQILQMDLSVRTLFTAPTIASFAEFGLKPNYELQTAIKPVGRTENLPLSFAQARLWFLDKLDPNSAFYNIPILWRFSGKLNVTALQSSLNEIIRRHEALRTNFVTQENQPIQVIAETLFLPLEIVDLLYLPTEEREVEMQRLVQNEAVRSYDLEREPLIRATLLQLTSTEYVFILTAHHIIFDGWSTGVFVQELATLYTAFCNDKTPQKVVELPELPIQYADFAVWQRQWWEQGRITEQLSYWQKQLQGAPTLLELPTDRPRPAIQTNRGKHQQFTLPPSLGEAMNLLSKSAGVTPFMTFFAAFVTLLYRYTGEKDIVIGTPIAGRNRPEIEGIIGLFVNTLVLRTDLSDNPSFEQLLMRVREVSLQAYSHQDLPFEKLVDALQPERSLSHLPLFQVMFDLQNVPISSLDLPGLSISSFPVETGIAKFDLALSIENTSSGLIAEWEYNSDLFDDSTIARMAGNFHTLVTGIVANPQQPISQLTLLTEIEQYQLLVDWNNTKKDYPLDKCIHQLFEEQVIKTPDAVAVEIEGEKLTYQELNQRANQLANYLQKLGVNPEVLVGICVERSLLMVVGLLGILKAGGAYVPLDPAYPAERLAYMLDDSQAKVLLTQQQLVNSIPNTGLEVICLDTDWELISTQSDKNPQTQVKANNLAYVIYTSGSTGKPKGVMIEHRSLVNLTQTVRDKYGMNNKDRVLQAASISFDAAAEEIYPCLICGGTLVLRTAEMLGAVSTFVQKCWEWKLTVLTVGTAYWQQLTAELATTNETLPPSVRLLSTGGEQWLPEKLKLWQKCMEERSSIQNLKAPPLLMNGYGPTEATVLSTVYDLSKLATEDTQPKQVIGNAFDNVQIYILDSYLQPVPMGVPGELHIGGMGLARGYLHRPDLTDAKFIPHPFNPLERIYKTGDLARYLPDGNIEFLGRIDNQVKIRGFRIELGEIETLLITHPQISEAVVIDSDDIPGSKRLVAYIVGTLNETSLPQSQLRSFLKQKLPDYMIPSAFVVLDALPLTPNGKVDRRGLPKPDTTSHKIETDLAAPRTESEEILAKIWCEVLHLKQVGIHDNFFELGGDSILSIQIIFKAKQAGLQLTAKQIFQNQTIAELAAVTNITQTVKAEQGLVTGLLPLTPIQHWFKEQNFPEPHHFNQSLLLELSGVVDWTLFPEVLRQLLLHHDTLRLRCPSNGEQINITPDDTIPFSYVDLSDIPDAEQKAAIEATASSLQTSLNLASGPIVQVAFFGLGTNKSSRLLIIIHHLAVDGVSWRILLEDLETAYQQISRGEKIQFRPKTTSFKYWAEKLNSYAQSDIAKQKLTNWQGISRTQITRIPVDHALGANTVAFNQIISVSLSHEETRALLQEVPKAYKTQINDILLTALLQTLGSWIGSNSVLLDLEGHGREDIFEDVDLSRTVGWFTTIFPVLLELKATDNLGDAIKSIKEQLRAVPNRGIGYGLLRYLSGDKDIISQLSTMPKAEVSFNYLGQFDWGRQENSFFKLASESVGAEHSQQENCSHLLDINGLVVDGQLKLDWTYSENFHHRDTIENLAEDFAANLRFLITHCLSIDVSANQEIYGFSQPINNYQHQENNVPVPLHLLELTQDISELLPDDTQFAYPLAKMQEFMLHHYANDHQKMGVYHGQELLDIYDENLSISVFKKALQILVEKHPTLRTVFIFQNGKPLCQVVRKNLKFSINEQDISNIKSDEQENYINAIIKQDRQNLFNVENCNEALFRLWLFRKAENRFEFFMSIHHAITDGWSGIEFVNQLEELYSALKQGEEITVIPANNVHQEFVALEKEIISSTEASNFWKLHLQNYKYKPLQPLKTTVFQVKSASDSQKAIEDNFNAEIILDLRECCRKLKVSPKAIFLSTYLDLISIVMKENQVSVGVISNGRIERLSDPFGALGLFWNIVPFCQTITEDKSVQIKNVQQTLIDIEPCVRYPLLEILSDQKTTELFLATFNFVNFHNTKTVDKHTSLKVQRKMIYDKFNFPLNYAISMESLSGNVSIHVEYDQTYFSYKDIQLMLQNYVEILKDRVYG
jgi:amino acid adenylation domain-containing protein/non-ribosomal peptide synthase protein (TIGR01720 family)